MKTIKLNQSRIGVLLLGTILFDLLFRKQQLGINLLLFTLIAAFALFIYFKAGFLSKKAGIFGIGNLLLVLAVAIHNSSIGVVLAVPSFMLWVSAVHFPKLQTFPYNVYGAIASLFRKPIGFMDVFKRNQPKNERKTNIWKLARIFLIPALVIPLFIAIFTEANPKFAAFADKIGTFIDQLFSYIPIDKLIDFMLSYVEAETIFFYLFGLFAITYLIFARKSSDIEQLEADQSFRLIRKKGGFNFFSWLIAKSQGLGSGLKIEYLSAFVVVALLNALLLIVNIIDIDWVWINFTYDQSFNLTQFVHEGTYLLILSILISIAIMLYYFRGNLNFYPRNRYFLLLVYAWIFQNAILVISVGLRNFHYITAYGLAYKRVGLIAFLLAVLIGLFTIWFKIRNKKTGFYLINANAWSVYAILIMLSLFNWDVTIAKYNLSGKVQQPVDLGFLLEMNPQVLPIIAQSNLNLNVEIKAPYSYKIIHANAEFERQKIKFLKEESEKTWLSFNWYSRRAYRYFTKP